MNHPRYIFIEFLLLCVALPTVIILGRLAPLMFPLLWAAALYCLLIFIRVARPDWKNIWNWQAINLRNLRPIMLRFAAAAIGIILFTWAYDPDRLFSLFYTRPDIIPRIMVFYPLLSALPQEFIFCTFFFWRYAVFFPQPRAMIFASALVFAFAHVLFINPVAPPLSFIAGLIFAQTYQKTRSLALVTLEHGFYGNALFLIGLGWYFYHGAMGP
ncbi:MAG TPA: CPBP family glutamic-type intramembrane protease [Alphaproteobacteria bacterium]|nr:CPBP family intramembrane metalloprotease [Rhodospirillaceae bacterium]HRJ12613.1 CPBP family glutamic-type intramembrane protease [Alphaproteobacteria bacterium]